MVANCNWHRRKRRICRVARPSIRQLLPVSLQTLPLLPPTSLSLSKSLSKSKSLPSDSGITVACTSIFNRSARATSLTFSRMSRECSGQIPGNVRSFMSLYIKEATLESKTRSNTATAVVSCVLFELLTLVRFAPRRANSQLRTAHPAATAIVMGWRQP